MLRALKTLTAAALVLCAACSAGLDASVAASGTQPVIERIGGGMTVYVDSARGVACYSAIGNGISCVMVGKP